MLTLRSALVIPLFTTLLLHAQPTPCVPPPSATLSVVLRAQDTSQWCWAASTQMILAYLKKYVGQCIQANNEFRRQDCCNTPIPEPCIRPGWPEFEKYGFRAARTSATALSWKDLTFQIGCRKTPVAFSWAWIGGGGHMMVAYGYDIAGGSRNVYIYDPLPVDIGTDQHIPYENYVSGLDHGHWDDFYDLQSVAGATLSLAVSATPPTPAGKPLTPQQAPTLPLAKAVAPARVAEARKVAEKQIRTFTGFESLALAPGASLEEPYPEYFIRLDHLAAYTAGRDPSKLLSGGTRLVFPYRSVAATSLARDQSSIVVEESQGKWRYVSTNHAIAAAVLAVRTRFAVSSPPGSPTSLTPPPLSVFAVHLLGLNRYYIGRTAGSSFFLRALEKNMQPAAEERPAGDVLLELAPLAKSVNTNAPAGY